MYYAYDIFLYVIDLTIHHTHLILFSSLYNKKKENMYLNCLLQLYDDIIYLFNVHSDYCLQSLSGCELSSDFFKDMCARNKFC